MMRTLIVDDEEPARERLRELLEVIPAVEVVGEAADGEEAMLRVAELRPDLMLLDIQMPGPSGLEVAACLASPRPRIIFCTAYNQYAVNAFEVQAVDYLLKPVSGVRLTRAIERAQRREPVEAETGLDRITRPTPGRPVRWLARYGDHYRVIPQQDVVYFSSEGGLTRVHTRERQYVLDPTLNELETRIDPVLFFRVSRAAIVNLDCVKEVRQLDAGSGDLTLSTGRHLEVSRRRLRDLLVRLGGCASAGH